MFARRPKLPVTPDQQEWIEISFVLLTELFGAEWIREAPLVLPAEKFFPMKWAPTEAWANFAFDRVCELMRVQRERVELTFVEDSEAALRESLRKSGINLGSLAGVAGTYRKVDVEDGASLAQIQIKSSLFDKPETMVATMAHEVAHVLLLGDGRIPRELERMEPLTDLMTVFSGFGILSANSAFVHKSGSGGWSVSRSGYLSPREYGYSLAVFAWTRGEHNLSWEKELTIHVRPFLRDSLAYFKSSGRTV